MLKKVVLPRQRWRPLQLRQPLLLQPVEAVPAQAPSRRTIHHCSGLWGRAASRARAKTTIKPKHGVLTFANVELIA